MDFLDPKKDRRNRLRLLIGYGLVAIAIGMTTLVLIFQAYGYGIDRQGNVTQSGILFVSSLPANATITLSGQRYKSNTNSRVSIPAGTYDLQVAKAGYRTWQRQVVVNGGDVQHFDYPFLFPQTLKTTSLAEFNDEPTQATQSPDKRWLLLSQVDSPAVFTEYDLKNPAKPLQHDLTLPASSFTPGDGPQTWAAAEWASDNRHVLLLHTYMDGATRKQEYILFDRDTPADTVNITSQLGLAQTQTIDLFNNKIDQIYAFDSTAATLRRINLSDGSVVSTLNHVLAYKPYADNMVLYVTDQPPAGKAVAGKVTPVLQDGQKTIALRPLPAAATAYALNLVRYSGDWYIAVGASNDTAAYIYKNPQDAAVTTVDSYPAPWRRLPVPDPAYLAFSANAQFLLAENGQNFVVYDFENTVQYHYHAAEPIDLPATHAIWMDGDRLEYVSGGKLLVFDYDYRNRQTLVTADTAFPPFFAQNYSYLYALRSAAADGSSKPALTSTALTVKP